MLRSEKDWRNDCSLCRLVICSHLHSRRPLFTFKYTKSFGQSSDHVIYLISERRRLYRQHPITILTWEFQSASQCTSEKAISHLNHGTHTVQRLLWKELTFPFGLSCSSGFLAWIFFFLHLYRTVLSKIRIEFGQLTLFWNGCHLISNVKVENSGFYFVFTSFRTHLLHSYLFPHATFKSTEMNGDIFQIVIILSYNYTTYSSWGWNIWVFNCSFSISTLGGTHVILTNSDVTSYHGAMLHYKYVNKWILYRMTSDITAVLKLESQLVRTATGAHSETLCGKSMFEISGKTRHANANVSPLPAVTLAAVIGEVNACALKISRSLLNSQTLFMRVFPTKIMGKKIKTVTLCKLIVRDRYKYCIYKGWPIGL